MRTPLSRTLVAAFLVAAIAATSLLAGCGSAPSQAPTAEAPAPIPPKGSIVFDMGHREIFSPDDTSPLGQSMAIQRMENAGFRVNVNTDTITPDDLSQASGLIIAGPMVALSDEEYAAVTDFAERGGIVLLTIHVPFPVLKVPAHWGMPVGTSIIMSKRPADPQGGPSVLWAVQVRESAVTSGVAKVLVISGWPVAEGKEGSKVVIGTSGDSWLSSIGDKDPKVPADDKMGSFGVLGVTTVGKGMVVVSGDDALFANVALSQGDNAKLLDNIIELMSKASDI